MKTVLVLGGGASGMMAAITAARNGARVTLLDKNRSLGRKLRITGGGRCNIYNAEHNLRLLLANYGAAEQSLYSAYTTFGPSHSKEFFDQIGIATKVEARQRAFPVSEKAEDVANAMAQELRRLHVDIQMGVTVTDIKTANGTISEVVTTNTSYQADAYILATGGQSKPETGSTGDGFVWLKQLGHSVKPPTPTITPLQSSTPWIHSMSGKSLQDVTIAFTQENTRQFSLHGDILCTHFGISGPLILNNAFKVADLLNNGDVGAEIDCYPKLDHKQLDSSIRDVFAQNPGKQVKSVLKEFVPAGMSATIIELLPEVDFTTKTSEFAKKQRSTIVHLLKKLPLTIDGLMGFEKAVVADGGVDITEIDMRTMQSNIIENLYVTGDLLNIRRPSGGYSLQLSWTTGYIAGSHAAQK